MSKFNLGDSVQLKSGGPTMTVQNAAGGDTVECIYFTTSGKLQRESFKVATLVEVKYEQCNLTGLMRWIHVTPEPKPE